MEYYYTEKKNIDKAKGELIVDNFEYQHLVKSLRKRLGDIITITDGELGVYECRIESIGKEKITCRILKSDFDIFEPSKNIHLYIAVLKNSERFEFAIEKAVELGVKYITPVLTERVINKSDFSVNKQKRLEHIIFSAMGQSQRCFKPVLNKAEPFSVVLSKTSNSACKLAMYEFADETEKISEIDKFKEIDLLTGPEGGFSDEEVSQLKQSNWQILSLGSRKLRAETAVIAAISKILI